MKLKSVSSFKYTFLFFSLLFFLFIPAISFAKPISAIIYPNDAKITEHHTADTQSGGDRYSTFYFLPIHA